MRSATFTFGAFAAQTVTRFQLFRWFQTTGHVVPLYLEALHHARPVACHSGRRDIRTEGGRRALYSLDAAGPAAAPILASLPTRPQPERRYGDAHQPGAAVIQTITTATSASMPRLPLSPARDIDHHRAPGANSSSIALGQAEL